MKKTRSRLIYILNRSLFISMLLLFAPNILSQITIKGSVVDITDEPLVGVNIMVKDTKIGAITDIDGKFSILVPNTVKNPILLFSYLGFNKKEVLVKKSETLKITLNEEAQSLDEVVVVGYGTVVRRDLTGSVDKVDIKEMQKAAVPTFDESLAGRVAGVNVVASDGTPGVDASIIIRGANSITQSNSPLYVIDGFPVESSLSSVVDPSDIESMEILKDASATAIYGARGANGVILITTKSGTASKPTLTYNGYFGVQNVAKTMDLMDGYEFVKMQGEVFGPETMEKYYFFDGRTLDDYRGTGTDFQEQLFRQAITQKHGISLMSGSGNTKYSASFSYTDQRGVVINSGFKRYQGRVSVDQDVRKWLKIGVKASYSQTKYYGPWLSEGSGTYSLLQNTWAYRPVTGSSNFDLENDLFDPILNTQDNYRINPIVAMNNEIDNRNYTYFMTNGYVDISLPYDLKFRSTIGYSKDNSRNDTFNNSKTRSGNPVTTTLGVNGGMAYDEKMSWVSENTLTYKKKIRKHSVEGLGGLSVQKGDRVYTYVRMQQVPYEQLGMSGLDQGEFYSMETYRNDWVLASGYARFNYNYDWKYYLTATMRADGSSKFSDSNKWGYFPSASVMWRFNKEKFMKGLKFINDAKLRVSWGLTGNNRVSEYASLPQITADKPNKYYFGNTPILGTAKTVMGNPDLKWETTMQSNIGLDLKLFNNRINFTGDLYLKRTRDLLLNAQLPGSFGYATSYKNIGEVENRGLELTLNTLNVKTKDFSWETNFNIAFNKNKVLALTENQETIVSSVWWEYNWQSQPAYIARIGEPLGQMYGFVYEGTYKYDDFTRTGDTYYLKDNIAYPGARKNVQPGDMKYRDINDDGVIDDNDRTIIGRGTPIHTGGFTNVFRYKDFDLSIFFQWSYGNDIINANKYMFERYYMPNSNMFASYINRWTPENPNSDIPRINEGSGGYYSTYGIEDGSYLRLKTVTLGYNMPKKIANKLYLQNVRIFVSGQNLWTWTKYTGMDPEVSTRNNVLTPGFDFSAYPRARTFSIGLNMSLK